MSSTIDSALPPLKPVYPVPDPSAKRDESAKVQELIEALNLIPHIEGGYFVETDRDPHRVPNPFLEPANPPKKQDAAGAGEEETTFYTGTGCVSAVLPSAATERREEATGNSNINSTSNSSNAVQNHDGTRNASTSIHYLLTPSSPLGAFHRNKGRTIHTLHRGRGRYVIIHADEAMPAYDSHVTTSEVKKARVETFVVGLDLQRGERVQWIVEGGKYKASFLLEDDEGRGAGGGGESGSGGLLISETVVPGFEYTDHDFMRAERLKALVTKEQADEMRWMLRKDDAPV